MDYVSTYSGTHIDDYNNRIATLEKTITTLTNTINYQLDEITNLQSVITNNNNVIAAKVYYKNGKTDGLAQQFTGGVILFDQKVFDTGNNFDTTTGMFIVPVDGLYLTIWNFHNVQTAIATSNYYTAIVHTDSAGTIINYSVKKSIPLGNSLTHIFSASVGDKFYAGSYTTAGIIPIRCGRDFN